MYRRLRAVTFFLFEARVPQWQFLILRLMRQRQRFPACVRLRLGCYIKQLLLLRWRDKEPMRQRPRAERPVKCRELQTQLRLVGE